MARFDRQIATAKRLIKKNGQLVQWRQRTSVADPDQPWLGGAPVDTFHDVYIAFVSDEQKDDRKSNMYMEAAPSTTIGRIPGLMGAVDFVPSLEDVVIRDGAELRLVTMDILRPNNQVIMYTLEFEG